MDSADSTRRRVAVIDVGTNAIRLMVAEAAPDGEYRVLREAREMTRLGSGLQVVHQLSEDSMERSLEAIGEMKAITDELRAGEMRVIATSAVREASNGPEFCAEAQRRLGLRIEVITAEEEARLAFASACGHFPLEGRRAAVVDIGGGSVEIVLSQGTVIEHTFSLPLGAIRLTERFGHSDPWRSEDQNTLREEIDRVIQLHVSQPLLPFEIMIGSGGTFTTLGEMIHMQREGPRKTVHGFVLTRMEVEDVLHRLFRTTLSERRQIPGLNPERADIIVAGAAVAAGIAKTLDIQRIQVNERGIRDGLLRSMIAAFRTGNARPRE